MKVGYFQFINQVKGILQDKKIPEIDEIINNLNLSSVIQNLFDNCIFILDYRIQQFLYISPNSLEIQGYTDKEIMEIGPIKIMDLFHNDDAKIISEKIFVEGDNAIKKLPNHVFKKLKISFTHRFLQKDGSYIHLKKQFSPLLIDRKNKKPLVIMGNTTLLDYEFTQIESSVYYQTFFNKWICIHKKSYKSDLNYEITLTQKELEIVKLISDGLSSKEIAAKTHKSIETINTQRKNILTKTNTQSMTEVVVMAIKNQWI